MSFISLHWTFSGPFVEKAILSSLNYFRTFIVNQLTTYVLIYFWTLFCFSGIYMCTLKLISCCLEFCNFTKTWLSALSPPTLFFFPKLFWPIYVLCISIQINFTISTTTTKKTYWNSVRYLLPVSWFWCSYKWGFKKPQSDFSFYYIEIWWFLYLDVSCNLAKLIYYF